MPKPKRPNTPEEAVEYYYVGMVSNGNYREMIRTIWKDGYDTAVQHVQDNPEGFNLYSRPEGY